MEILDDQEMREIFIKELLKHNKIRFRGSQGKIVTGTITKRNRTTIHIKLDSGTMWKVSVGLIEKAE